MDQKEQEVVDALKYIRDVDDYDTWLHVGMALKDGGFPVSLWEDWSKNGSKFVPGDCESKWDTFNNDGFHIDSVFWLAQQNGYHSSGRIYSGSGGWDSILPDDTEVLNKEGELPIYNSSGDEFEQLSQYLELMFDENDIVGYCTEFYKNKNGEMKPGTGDYTKTAGSLLKAINQYKETKNIEKVIGPYNHDLGVYIRVNALDGKGESDKNVTKFKYTLIESDTQSLERQNYLIHEFKLPIKCLVYSGGKSIHALVHIDAKDSIEYRDRVRWMHQILIKWGLECDKQDKNPSRYTRMPGIQRGDKQQTLLETDIGMADFNSWQRYAEEMEDGLPDPVPMNTVWDHLPPISPVLIDGVLRLGHKMILSAESKSGKSFALIELALAISEGMNWLGHRCTQGKVLYINMEIDEPSLMKRVKDVYTAMGLTSGIHPENFIEWTLRGYGRTLTKLVPSIIRRTKGQGYSAIIIDPLYKVLEGDENSNSDIAQLVSLFDKIARETGASVIYAHHFAKGYMGDRSSIDRGAGAGTFSRDPDAIVTMTQLDWSDPEDSDHRAFQVDYTLREFHGIEAQKIFWKYPIHVLDSDHVLDNVDLKTSMSEKTKRMEELKDRKTTKETEEAYRIVSNISKYGECKGFVVPDFIKEYKRQTGKVLAKSTVKDILKRSGYCQSGETIGSASIWKIDES